MWPTWADLLSLEFDEYYNWGWVGLGNRAIAERIAEAHSKHTFTNTDTVIVQWSTILRHDWHNDKAVNGSPGWQTNGNVFCPKNINFYPASWYDNFYSERSWTMHTLNYIISTQGLLNNIGCTWRMTGIGDIRHLGTDLERDLWNYERVSLLSAEKSDDYLIWSRYPEFKSYQSIWAEYLDMWVDPIMPTATKYDDLYWWFQAKHDKEPWKEGHPSPVQHQKWLIEKLKPSLDITTTLPAQETIINQCIELKKEHMDALKFEEFLMNPDNLIFSDLVWPNIKQGF
jgi:hypothetical protein